MWYVYVCEHVRAPVSKVDISTWLKSCYSNLANNKKELYGKVSIQVLILDDEVWEGQRECGDRVKSGDGGGPLFREDHKSPPQLSHLSASGHTHGRFNRLFNVSSNTYFTISRLCLKNLFFLWLLCYSFKEKVIFVLFLV